MKRFTISVLFITLCGTIFSLTSIHYKQKSLANLKWFFEQESQPYAELKGITYELKEISFHMTSYLSAINPAYVITPKLEKSWRKVDADWLKFRELLDKNEMVTPTHINTKELNKKFVQAKELFHKIIPALERNDKNAVLSVYQNAWSSLITEIEEALKLVKKDISKNITLKHQENIEKSSASIKLTEYISISLGFLFIAFSAYFYRLYSKYQSQKDSALEQSQKLAALGEMTAGMAHEISNPSAVIRAYISTLSKLCQNNKYDQVKFIKALEKMDASSERIAKIIKTMRVQSRKAKPEEKKYFNFTTMIDEIGEAFILKAKTKHVEYELLNVIEEDELNLYGDEVQVGQVLINLVNNAVDAAAEEDEQWVRIKLDTDTPNTITIHIVDSGHGIPMKVQEQMFDSFFTTKAIGEGTGLGMGITREIIHGHEGTIVIIDDEPNTTFRVTLPIRSKEDMLLHQEKLDAEESDMHDDDDDILESAS